MPARNNYPKDVATPGGFALDDDSDPEEEQELDNEAEMKNIKENPPRLVDFMFRKNFYKRKAKELSGKLSNKGRRCKQNFALDQSIAGFLNNLSNDFIEHMENEDPWVNDNFDNVEIKRSLLDEGTRRQVHATLRSLCPIQVQMKGMKFEQHEKLGGTSVYLKDIHPNCRQFVFQLYTRERLEDKKDFKMSAKIKPRVSDKADYYSYHISDAHNVWHTMRSLLPEEFAKKAFPENSVENKEERIRGWIQLEGRSHLDQREGINNWKMLEMHYPCCVRQDMSYVTTVREYTNSWPETEDSKRLMTSGSIIAMRGPMAMRGFNSVRVAGLEQIWEVSLAEVCAGMMLKLSVDSQKIALEFIARLLANEAIAQQHSFSENKNSAEPKKRKIEEVNEGNPMKFEVTDNEDDDEDDDEYNIYSDGENDEDQENNRKAEIQKLYYDTFWSKP